MPAKSLHTSSSRRYVVGVDIGGTNLRMALANARGQILARCRTSTTRISTPPDLIRHIRHGLDHLLRQTSLPRRSLQAIAVGVPGVTDTASGVVLLTSFFGQWRDVPLLKLLESGLDLPAAIENDVRLAAIGERWRGSARGLSDFVFLAIGTGIAAGIFANGHVLRGAGHAAGEVGYLFVPGTALELAAPGAPGPLECAIGGEGLRLQWQRICRENQLTLSRSDSVATGMFNRASAGDPFAHTLLRRTAQTLAYAIYDMAVVLNPSLFVLGGGVGVSPVLLEQTQLILRRFSEPAQPKLTVSALGDDAQLLGSIRLALDTAPSRAKRPK